MPYFFGQRHGDRVEITGLDAAHLARSLRARPGERISVVEPEGGGRRDATGVWPASRGEAPLKGRLLTVRLESVSAERVAGRVESEVEHRPEPDRRITLAVAMLPAAALEVIVSRCTEAGAAGFVLVEAERSVARRGGRHERWATICREAAMLAGRLVVPAVAGPMPFAAAWEQAQQPVLLDRGGRPLRAGLDTEMTVCTMFIGPEGGWSAAERTRAGEHVYSLGPRNLRADTAALVALAVAVHPG